MRVVYDLRYASDHFPGIGTHAYELLRALLDAPGEERWVVLGSRVLPNARFDLDRIRDHPRVEWHECDVPPLGFSTARRTGEVLRGIACDAYFSPFWLMPSGMRVPVVLTLHDVLPLAPMPGLAWWRRVAFGMAIDRASQASAVVTISRFSGDEIARWTRIPRDRVHVIPHGVPAPAQVVRQPAALPVGLYALVVGTNKPHKNLATLARAWRALGEDPPLALVGAGHADPRYPGLATLGDGLPAVRALGRVGPGELEWLYAHATVVVFPSLYEGFGFPLLEAMSRGVPVIASDLPVLREVGEGVARFVPATDAGAWAEAVRGLAADDGARRTMSGTGRERAGEYTYASCAASTVELLRGVRGRAR